MDSLAKLHFRCHLEERALSQLSLSDPKMHLVVVIGGETEGVSKKAHKFALESGGTRAFIPLFNDMESLNNLSAVPEDILAQVEVTPQGSHLCSYILGAIIDVIGYIL